MYSENIPVMTQVHHKKLNLLFPRSCNTNEAEMLLQLHHIDPTGEILRPLFAESLWTVNLYLLFLTRGFFSLSKGLKPLSTLDFRKLKTQWEIKVLFGLGILPYYTTGDSHWWSFVSSVPKCPQAKLLFALVEISWPPNSSKLHKCKSELLCLADICPSPWQGFRLEDF